MPAPANSYSLDLVPVSASTIYNNANLGTTPFVKFADVSTGSPNMGIRRVRIYNKHATAYVAFKLTSEASPSFSAAAAGTIATDEGVVVAPLSAYEIKFKRDLSLWLIASAASVPVQVVAYDVPA